MAIGRLLRLATFSVTGQPNAMGGRSWQVANMLANHLNWTPDRQVVQDWGSPTICTKPGLKAVDLFEEPVRTVKSRRFG
jgi:assimilatory nitrate reductase catalytic subunit